jgi:nitrogen fixation NifU-like protein
MTDLRSLYQKVILDHGRHPRNRRIIDRADHTAEGSNPLCGDNISVYIKSAGGRIEEIGFEGSGCLIAIASASMMTEAVEGRSAVECATLADAVDRIGDGGDALPEQLRALAGVSRFPVRIKCATLPWRILRAALNDEAETVTTE